MHYVHNINAAMRHAVLLLNNVILLLLSYYTLGSVIYRNIEREFRKKGIGQRIRCTSGKEKQMEKANEASAATEYVT